MLGRFRHNVPRGDESFADGLPRRWFAIRSGAALIWGLSQVQQTIPFLLQGLLLPVVKVFSWCFTPALALRTREPIGSFRDVAFPFTVIASECGSSTRSCLRMLIKLCKITRERQHRLRDCDCNIGELRTDVTAPRGWTLKLFHLEPGLIFFIIFQDRPLSESSNL